MWYSSFSALVGRCQQSQKEIRTPERPTSIVISNDDKTLYITSAGALYSKNLQ